MWSKHLRKYCPKIIAFVPEDNLQHTAQTFLPNGIYHEWTDFPFFLTLCYWSWKLESNRWKARSSCAAMYQHLSELPRPTVISHTSELKLNWNSQVSEMHEHPSATTSLTTYKLLLCFLPLGTNIFHIKERSLALDKSAFSDASE